jgi:hypothetical protein
LLYTLAVARHSTGFAPRRSSLRCAFLTALVLSLGASTFSSSAGAQEAATRFIEGHVVAVQDQDIIIDLAGGRGASDGDLVELWRPLVLRHPVTKRTVRERFRIGQLRLSQVRETLAMAVAEGQLDRAPEAGDLVLLRLAIPNEAEPSSTGGAGVADGVTGQPATGGAPLPASPAPSPLAELDPDVREAQDVARMFDSLSGTPIDKRIKAYRRYLQYRPRSRYARVLAEEAAMLQELLHRSPEQARQSIKLVGFKPPEEALGGVPFSLGLGLAGPVAGAVLHARRGGQVTYQSMPMKQVGAGTFVAVLPAEQMQAPELEYFIEAMGTNGRAYAVVGDPEAPQQLAVRDVPQRERPKSPQATVSAWTDYADYNRMRGDDVVWQTEGFFQMRLGDTGVRALRSGFGVYRGIGGSLEDLDEFERSPRKVGLTYGYLEVEVGIVDIFSLIGRGAVGLGDGGITGGGQAGVRIGNDQRTNLMLGGELLGGVGLRGIAQLELNVFDSWPMMVRTEVTNQPAGSESTPETVRPDVDDALPEDTSLANNDIGARGIVQVGYRIVDPLTVAVRGSYQGRTIKHSGPGFGGAISYTW